MKKCIISVVMAPMSPYVLNTSGSNFVGQLIVPSPFDQFRVDYFVARSETILVREIF